MDLGQRHLWSPTNLILGRCSCGWPFKLSQVKKPAWARHASTQPKPFDTSSLKPEDLTFEDAEKLYPLSGEDEAQSKASAKEYLGRMDGR